jgi:hypothetical protein
MRKELIIQICNASGAPISNLPYDNRTYFRGQTRNNGPQKGNVQNGQFQQNSFVRTKLLCFQCGQTGHYARNCFSNPNSNSEYKPVDKDVESTLDDNEICSKTNDDGKEQD